MQKKSLWNDLTEIPRLSLQFEYILQNKIMQYSEEETLRIKLPQSDLDASLFDAFTDDSRTSQIKHLVIEEKSSDGYSIYNIEPPVIIPDTISTLTEVECITIRACIAT